MAMTLTTLGETAEAEFWLREMLEVAQRTDSTHRAGFLTLIHYAEAALNQRKADTALKYFHEVVTQAVKDSNRYRGGRGLFGEARALIELGRLDEAKQDHARLAKLAATGMSWKFAEDNIVDPRVLEGLIDAASGNAREALPLLRAVLESNRASEGENLDRLRPIALAAATSAFAAGDIPLALRLAREARSMATRDSLSNLRSAFVGEARLVEARALLASGDSAGALTQLAAAVIALRAGAGEGSPRSREATDLLASLRRH